MRTSTAGKTFIRQREAFRSHVYLDSAGKPSIGFGHLILPDEVFTQISEYEAIALFERDLRNKAENCINSYVKPLLIQYEFDALASLVFNIGCGNFATSTLLKKLNDRLYSPEELGDEFLKWNKITDPVTKQKVVSKGLSVRREQERDMFLGKEVRVI